MGQIENLYTPDCIRTFTGRYVNVFNPTSDMFCIEDVAHALANMPRFAGHLKHFYSVGSHSIACCNSAYKKGHTQLSQFNMLMHDCSEAYLIDMPRPIKMRMPQYKEIEKNLMSVLSQVFGFTHPMSDAEVLIDNEQLEYEWSRYMLGQERPGEPDPTYVENKFLTIYQQFKAS